MRISDWSSYVCSSDLATAITELKVGEALVSLLQADGAPTPVERTLIRPPSSRLGPLSPAERAAVIQSSAVAGKYEAAVNRESAHEMLAERAGEAVVADRSEEHTAELQSLLRNPYDVFCLQKK